MGIVYEGRDPNLDRHVAIKTVKVENLSEEAAAEYEARFRTEARSAARLQHPNIVSVYDSDRDGDIAFLVMEYIQGDDLKHHLDKGVRYSLEQSLKMVRDLLSALDYAHRQGIVHRDIKPANLLIEPAGRVKLTDFGVARMQDSGDATRTQGTMVGTLKYMSPEQVQGRKIDARADLFSVGVVLYQLLTDKRPFDGENDFSIIQQIIDHTPPPPSSFNARLPPAIDAVVARALAKNREDRFASAHDFAAALQSAMRRAEDATVVPPADPSRRSSFGGSTPGGGRSLTGSGVSVPTSGSTVTQEVELVYWKDVKDTGDPEELQDFLVKFPAGIYADLARRRLRKLSGSMVFEATVATPNVGDPEATRLREATSTSALGLAVSADSTQPGAPAMTVPVASAAPDVPAAAAPISPAIAEVAPNAAPLMAEARSDVTVPLASGSTRTTAGSGEVDPAFAITIGQSHDGDTSPGARTGEASGLAAMREVDADRAGVSSQPTTRRRFPIPALAGIGALVAVGIAALLLTTGKGGGEKPLAQPASSASARVAAPAPPPAKAPESSEPAGAALATQERTLPVSSALPARSSGSSVRRPPTGAKSKAVASAPAVEAARPNRVVPPPVQEAREESRPPPPSPPPVVAVPVVKASPVDACKDKMFISREFCLAEQCAKPGTFNHPLCVKRREDAKLREESKVRN